jgi:phosphodiesterase/alkaline phosphatase D-like protein
MNKNILIGVLIAVVVVGGGYFLLKSASNTSTNQLVEPNATVTQTTSTTPSTTSPNTTTTATDTTPSVTLGTPILQTNPNATASISAALLNGQVTPRGTPTTYWFDYGETTSLGTKTKVQQIGSGFYSVSSPAYITGLRANTVYYFRLSATNNFGTENGNIYNFKTNSNPSPKAAMPTAHTSNTTKILRTTASLNGQVNPNGWQANYWFEYGKNSNFGNATAAQSITVSTSLASTTAVSQSISGLEPLTKYYFRLNAQNQFGTVNGTTLSFTTSGPLNPGVPIVTTSQVSKITNSSVSLNGRINPSGVNTTYWFQYSQDSLLGSSVNSVATQTVNAGTSTVNVQASVNGLNKNTKYFYRLVGQNQYGSVNGSIMSFTTKS